MLINLIISILDNIYVIDIMNEKVILKTYLKTGFQNILAIRIHYCFQKIILLKFFLTLSFYI